MCDYCYCEVTDIEEDTGREYCVECGHYSDENLEAEANSNYYGECF